MGRKEPVLWAAVHSRAADRRDKQQSAFGYVVGHLYFYEQKDWPGGMSYECRGKANAFTLAQKPLLISPFSLIADKP
jgi:hypothetical protein